MMTRRKLLLWGVPAAIGLAVVAIFTALLSTPSEASHRSNKIQLGMTREQVREILGKESSALTIPMGPESKTESLDWEYDDDSMLVLTFDSTGLVVKKTDYDDLWPLPWYDRLRYRLRKAGLPI